MGRSDPRNEGKHLQENMFLGVALVRIYASINQKRLIGQIGVDHEHHDGFNHVFRLAQPANRNTCLERVLR